ncbi:MAG TPA: hypothetical protein VHB97_14865 [Polyangia bacterium]|nr:hypothetical protein [Polyangia bacterium]
MRAVAESGVHLVVAGGAAELAAGALVLKAMQRADVRLDGVSVIGWGEALSGATLKTWLHGAPALVVVGGRSAQPLLADVPQLAIANDPAANDGEPLVARAFRLCETLTPLADATWCAAAGLGAAVDDVAPPHTLVERALARHSRAELVQLAELLDGATRGPEPAREMLTALEMLAAAPDPRRFLDSEPGQLLVRNVALVRQQAALACRLRPRAGFGVLVVEYDSPCRIEDLDAQRWRGLRPGTAVLVANHGGVAGHVAVTARAALPEALERLHAVVGDAGHTLLPPMQWSQLLARLGVVAAPVEALYERSEPRHAALN